MSSSVDRKQMFLSGFKMDPEPKWMELAPMLEKRHVFGAVALDENCIMVTGGHDGFKTLKNVNVYDKRTNEWTSDGWPDLNVERCCHSSVICNNKVYVIGGYNLDGHNNRVYLSTIECLDLLSSSPEWVTLEQKLSCDRTQFAAVAVGNLIYVMGGFDGKSGLSFVEVFDTKTGLIHQDQPNMVSVRNACTAALVGNKIWVVGGRDNDRNTLNTIEYLEVGLDTGFPTGQWTMSTAKMTTKRYFSCVAVVGHCLVIIGGKDDEKNRLSSAEVLDTSRDMSWDLPSLSVPRYACATVTLGDSQVVAMGGFGSGNCHRSVESLTQVFNEVITCFELSERKCIEGLSTGNVTTIVRWAHLLGASRLLEACLTFINENGKSLFMDVEFLALAIEEKELWKCIVDSSKL